MGAVGVALLAAVFWILNFIYWLVIIWVILSWVVFFMSQSSARWKYRRFFETIALINDFFERATRPLLAPFRRLLPPSRTAGIDWSPLLLLLAIYVIRVFLFELVRG
ncbi:MAG: YggT family protein [Acidobacteria bacterium]|nr:YggT family protein [Acidobacteriota bacterium]